MSTKPQVSDRLEIVDGMRGIAVLCMLVLHTAHGWMRPELRAGTAWYWITSIGGMAAPLFFLLAGVSLGLAWARRDRRNPRAEVARGLSLVVLGYLLRVQMWVLDGPPAVDATLLAGPLILGLGEVGIYRSCILWGTAGPGSLERARGTRGNRRWRSPESHGIGLFFASAVVSGIGLFWAADDSQRALRALLRFDVLQGLGLSLTLINLATWGAERMRTRLLLSCACAAGLLAAAPWLQAWLPGPLAMPMAAALAKWTAPAPGGSPWTLFPLAPWGAYTALGTLVGAHWQHSHQRGHSTRRFVLPWAALGLLLAAATSEELSHTLTLLRAHPALTQPVRVGYRLGIGLAGAGVTLSVLAGPGPIKKGLTLLGGASLWIYWVHLEFAFGTLGLPLRGALTHEQWAVMMGLLLGAMLGLAWMRSLHHQVTRPERRTATAAGATNVGQGA